MKKMLKEYLTMLVLILLFALTYLMGYKKGKDRIKLIYNPLLIYSDLTIKHLDYPTRQGLYCIIDEKDLRKLLNKKDIYDFLVKEKRRKYE